MDNIYYILYGFVILYKGYFILKYLYKRYVCKFTEIIGTKYGNSKGLGRNSTFYRAEIEFTVKGKLYTYRGKSYSLFKTRNRKKV